MAKPSVASLKAEIEKYKGNVRAQSEKQDKRNANRRLRRAVRQGKWHLTLRDVSNVWDFARDGKKYVQNVKPEYMRK